MFAVILPFGLVCSFVISAMCNTLAICLLTLRSLFCLCCHHPPSPPPSWIRLRFAVANLLFAPVSLHPSYWPSHLFIFPLSLLTVPLNIIIIIPFLFNIYSYSCSFWHLPLADHFISGWIYLYPFNVFPFSHWCLSNSPLGGNHNPSFYLLGASLCGFSGLWIWLVHCFWVEFPMGLITSHSAAGSLSAAWRTSISTTSS